MRWVNLCVAGGLGLALAGGLWTPRAQGALSDYVYAYTSAYGNAQSVYEDDTGDPNGLSGDAQQAHSDYQADNYASDGTTLQSYSEGKGRAIAFQGVGAYAAVGGSADDGSGDDLEAYGEGSQYVSWYVRSDTLADGTPVKANISLSFDGTLTWNNDSNGVIGPSTDYYDYYSDIYGSLQYFQSPSESTIYEGDVSLYAGGLDEMDDDWAGKFTHTDDGNGYQTATANFTDMIQVDTTVGSMMEFQLTLVATVRADAPVGFSAAADFYNSGSLSVSPVDGTYQFVQVPEPASLIWAGMFLPLLLRRRRRD